MSVGVTAVALSWAVALGVLPVATQTYATSLAGQAKGEFLDVGGAKIYYESCGSGPAIVLVHDGLMHSVIWDGVWAPLCQRYHVVRYDRRGYGQSPAPAGPFLQTDDLEALLGHLGISGATVVGCSSGGGIAIDYALAHPARVTHLILIGSVLHGMVVTSHFTDRGARHNAMLEHGDIRAVAEQWAGDPYETKPGHDSARRVLYSALVASPQNLRYTGEFEVRPRRPAVLRLGEISVPTLILDGEFDIPDVQAFAGAIQAGVPGARREIVRDAGHLIPLEQPAYLAGRIARFIDTHRLAIVPIDVLRLYVGRYVIDQDTIDIALRHGRLMIQQPAEVDLPLFPESTTKAKVFLFDHDADIEFMTGRGHWAAGAQITAEDGTVSTAHRIGGVAP